MPTPRIESLKQDLYLSPRPISLERARWITRYYQANQYLEPPLLRAEAVRYALNHVPVRIYPGELIAGAMTEKKMGALLFPEFDSVALWPELRKIHLRKDNPFVLTEEEARELEKDIFPFWLGKTVADRAISMLLRNRKRGGWVPGAVNLGVEVIRRMPISWRRKLLDLAAVNLDSLKNRPIGFTPFRLFALEGVMVLTEFAGISHVTPDYQRVVEKGFGWIWEQAEEKLKNSEYRQERIFLESVIIAANGVMEFAERYAGEAENLARKERDPVRKTELETISENLKNAPRNPARTFAEALQAVWLTQVALHHENYEESISLGRVDQYLYPLYRKDIAGGRLTREQAKELLQCLWIKMSSFPPLFPELFNRYFSGLMTSQGAVIGGVDREGRDATNDLTGLILESIREVNTHQPNLFARVNPASPPDYLRAIETSIASGSPHPSIYNDEVIIPAMQKVGASLEDARDYAPLGCVEPNPQGRSFGSTDAALLNLGLCLELALNNGVSPMLKQKIGPETGRAEDFASMADVLRAFSTQVSYLVHQMVRGTNVLSAAHKEYFPSPLLSALIQDTLEKKKDVTSGGARYDFTGVQGVGVGSVADALTAIDEAVFARKRLTMADLLKALKEDFTHDRELKAYLTNRVSKYGDDEGRAEKYAHEVFQIYAREVKKHRNPRGGFYLPGYYSVTCHIPFGKWVGALPSGRGAGEPLTLGISPSAAGTRKGPTAFLRSVAAIDFTEAANGSNLTMGLDPRVFAPGNNGSLFVSLLRSYFKLGGMQVQFNVLDEAVLRDAQKDPDKFRWMTVRVAGYCAYFTDLTKEAQDEIIQRVSRANTA